MRSMFVFQGGADTNVLLQLPHFDYDVVKKLGRKKVRSLVELSAMDAQERLELFVTSGAAPSLSFGDLGFFDGMHISQLWHAETFPHRMDCLSRCQSRQQAKEWSVFLHES